MTDAQPFPLPLAPWRWTPADQIVPMFSAAVRFNGPLRPWGT